MSLSKPTKRSHFINRTKWGDKFLHKMKVTLKSFIWTNKKSPVQD